MHAAGIGDRSNGTIAALVPLAAAGDGAAFTRIVAACHSAMARVAYVICGGDPEVAQDVLQSTWTIAWSRLRTLRDPQRICPWLISVTANEARQLVHDQRHAAAVRLETTVEGMGIPDPAGPADAVDVATVLRLLSPDDRTLVALHYAVGYDAREIGAVLGVPASKVGRRLEQLLDRVRDSVEA